MDRDVVEVFMPLFVAQRKHLITEKKSFRNKERGRKNKVRAMFTEMWLFRALLHAGPEKDLDELLSSA